MKKFMACALFVSAIFITACTDGTIIGGDLVGDEEISILFEDGFEFSGQTVLGDSIATYNITTTNQTYLLGQIDDPTFGKYSSDIYTAIAFNSAFPNFDNTVIDSIVLDLEYDDAGFYGDTTVSHTIEVFRVIEDFVSRDTIFSNESFMTDMVPLATKTLVPSRSATIPFKVRDLDVDSTIDLSPRLRIQLDNAYGTEILENGDAEVSDSALIEAFKGLYIRTTPNGSSMMGLNFNENPDFNDGIARLHLYYTKTNSNGEEFPEDYSYLLRSVTSSTFNHDYDGSAVGDALIDPLGSDQFIYSHSMAGVNAEINFPDLNFLDNNNQDTIIINSAQLVLTVNEDEAMFQTETYPPATQFVLSKDNEEGEGRVLIDDITKDGIDLSFGLQIHDGIVRETILDDGSEVKTVSFVITDYIRNLLNDDISSSKITISPIGRSESPRRTVFYGLNHPDFPAKLRIAYTKI
ncbi:MAG: DUF4270 domain-containing protein [Saprospiraceae bacterium]|nr:DUF4270 domain-containing protein [Saprospiraceae bacterium]